MPFKRFKGFNPKTYKTVAIIFFGVILVETFFLIKFHSQTHVKKSPAVRVSTPMTGKIKKKTTAKVAANFAEQAQSVLPPAAVKPIASQGKIAIIIDDSGYNLRDCTYLREIDQPITISILPDVEHSREIAQCAHAVNKEVMLHLPLEAYEYDEHYPPDYIINTEMPKGQIIDRLEESLQNVPYADGVNNHMGSKATENIRLMSILFAQLLHKNLFFVDSRVTPKSVAPKLARQHELPFAQRDVFLDNINRRPEIEIQFQELARVAKKKGSAIGIGHARKLTWEMLSVEITKLTEQGFEIVPVRTIVDQK